MEPPFLDLHDYQITASEEEMAVIAHNPKLWRKAEHSAKAFISAYLSTRYDMNKAYKQTGEYRNPLLIKLVADITIWYLIQRLPEFMGYDRREPNYLEARRLLEQIQKGAANIDLPLLSSADEGKGGGFVASVRGGSMKKNTYNY